MSTEAENSLVMELAGGTENTWLGGHDTATEGTYAWRWGQSLWPRLFQELLYYFSDGTAWSFTKWKNNAPNNGGGNSEQDCVSMGTTGEWDDVACSTERCGYWSRYPVLMCCAGSTCVRRGTCSRPPPPHLPPAAAAPAGLLSNA